MYIFSVIRKSLSLFDGRQRLWFVFLMAFLLASAVLQIAGVASIGPFIAILSDPSIIHENKYLSDLRSLLEIKDDKRFIIACAVISMIMTVFSNLIAILTLWALTRFSIAFGVEFQSKLFLNFVGRPFVFHKSSNYTRSIAIINQEAPRFVYMVLQPMLLLFSNLFVAVLIMIGLIVMNPYIALGSAVVLGGAYFLTYAGIKRSLVWHGEVLTSGGRQIQSILSEAFVGIKDIILNSLGEKYARQFREVNAQGLNSSAYITLSGDVPKFVIETISFAAILLLAVVLLVRNEPISSIVSLLSIYALAGYKLLPTMQQIYKSVSNLSAHGSVPFELSYELSHYSQVAPDHPSPPLGRVERITLNHICYSYPESAQLALDDVSLVFNAGCINTVAGHSGSGKSTLIDIILGLLEPASGQVEVDGHKLDGEFSRRYKRSIGYVPQTIFLLDDDVIANVAFGSEMVDINKVRNALRLANAIDFVDDLPNGLHTRLGQDGKMLSGGQRQRIGIARSLYRNSSVLVLDEPTSALDIESEYEFVQVLMRLKADVLVIVISHRPAAIKCSDNIVLLEKGRVLASGSLQHLMVDNPSFREMMEKGMML